MPCYYHPFDDAVGVCRSCGRAICDACSAEVAWALACRNRCEERAALLLRAEDVSIRTLERAERMMEHGERMMKITSPIYAAMASLLGILGVALLSAGIFQPETD